VWDNNLPTVAAWVSVFVGLMSILMLISSFFLYAIAAGEEPKMKKAHGVLWGGIIGIVLAILVYFIGGRIG
jgi:hypothetical protein